MSALPDHQTPNGYSPAAPIAPVAATRRPSAGEAARTLAHHGARGALSTIAVEPAGYPYGSVAPYALLGDGSPIVFISTLAEHTSNLTRDHRASLLITDPHPIGDPMDNGRLTLVADAAPLRGSHEIAVAREIFAIRHPDAAGYITFGDFACWVLRVVALRWIGGFGRMAWCTPSDYADAEPDPTAPVAPAAVEHLNADHADALLAAARAFTGHPDATAARATRLDRYGIELTIATPRGQATGRAGFEPRVDDPAGVRAAAVELTRRARERS
jgi:hypothetical protein